MVFFVGKCGFTHESMGYIIEIHRIPYYSTVDSLDLGYSYSKAFHFHFP